MNPFPEYIVLNGEKALIKEFIQKDHPSGYEKTLAEFLSDWYGPGDFIEVKTSGSTGTPKTIRLKKEFVTQSALRTLQFFSLKACDRVLHCLPNRFIAGKLMAVRALVGNLDLFVADPQTDFSFLQDEKFRFAAMVPQQVSKILDTEPKAGAWINNIGQLLIGGSALPLPLANSLKNISTPCYSSYAMTETATHIALQRINGQEPDDYYHCLEGINCGLSENGCLQVFMPGIGEQLLTTTDLAEVKDEKTFRILGRIDNVIISGGIKYSPEQLEKKLEPFIDEPFLISSLPHESLGQQLVLVVERKESKALKAQLQETCRNQLEKYEQPRQIFFVQEIPKNQGGKIDRKSLFLTS